MRFSPRWLGTVVSLAAVVLAGRAELPDWFENTSAGSALEAALYRTMTIPGGPVLHVRPPAESRSRLTKLLQSSPRDIELYAIRAREEERALNIVAAEADWRFAAAHTTDRLAGQLDLADFYERRAEPDKGVSALLDAASSPPNPGEQWQPDPQQGQWTAFVRANKVAADWLLPVATHDRIFEFWIGRYPKNAQPYGLYLDWLLKQKDRQAARALAARIKSVFPDNVELVVTTDATLAQIESGSEAALDVYAKQFSPLWPDALRAKYFRALSDTHRLRSFLNQYQSEAAHNPTALEPVLRLYFYYEQQNRRDLADQQLIAFLRRAAAAKAALGSDELKTVAPLFERAQDYDESAHAYYSLYELPSASAADKELAIAALIALLLDVPEQPLDFGNRDLSLYKNIAGMDRRPGFLNGILSLALNSTYPGYQYQNASQDAVRYFHRASASRLLEVLRQASPNSQRIPALEAKLFNAYRVYGEYEAITRLVPAWLKANRNSPEYVDTALLLADAYINISDIKEELALYDRLLADLSAESDHMPLGAQQNAARSPDYARILDRYISRLVALNRKLEAVALFRREIDRNPDDPGIYERLALFVEQNQLDSDLEQTYRQAFAHFKDTSWASKLARFYLKQKQYSAYQALTRQITNTFRGSDLAAFLNQVAPAPGLNPKLYLQIVLYAHKRFPHNLIFVRSLLYAYRTKQTEDLPAYEKLLRENWYYDASLRTSFYQYLSESGKLQVELSALPGIEQATAENNLAALQFRAEGSAWLTDYESAAPAFVRLCRIAPGDRAANDRAIAIQRSLVSSTSGAFDSAIHVAAQDVTAAPSDRAAITRVGEIYADRSLYAQARPWWNRIPGVQPGVSDGYLQSATVFWDYYQFDDALRMIANARQKLGNRALFAYEAGAIYENQGKYKQAVGAYIQAVLEESSSRARARLLRLSGRNSTAQLVEQQTAQLTNDGFNAAGFSLRLAVLEKQKRRAEIKTLLTALLPRVTSASDLEDIRQVATRLGFDEIAAQSIERTVAITKDPVEKLQTRINLARFYEAHGNALAAEREFASLLQEQPDLLGVIRSVIDFYWRENQPQKAVSTLEAAAARAQQPYHDQLRREAAQKATDTGEYDEARRLLRQLLESDPYNGDLLAAMASTYAREGDNSGLAAFYSAELKAIQSADLPGADKQERIAVLRRGYIAALVRLQQFREALDQYELVLNHYPEDAGLAAEVARFAESHELASDLIAYYQTATQNSPRDYRWPLVLARIDARLRQYPEAIVAYEKAAHIRPDRSDILVAKADLETRLQRFNDAIKTYQSAYELNYHDPQYLADQATLYARLGNRAEALRLVRAACIESHGGNPAGYVSAMRRLVAWRMFEQVDQLFSEVQPSLVSNPMWLIPAVSLEAEALTSLHRPIDAISLVAAMVKNQAEVSPFAQIIGQSAQKYLTPHEKQELAEQIQKQNGLPPQFADSSLANDAGLYDVAAEALVKRAQTAGDSWQMLNQLQSSRLLYEQLGQELEAIAKKREGDAEREQIAAAALQAYRNAGDTAAQMRLSAFAGSDFPSLFVSVSGDLQARLAQLARRDPNRANSVVQYLIANHPAQTVIQAISTRGKLISPLWINCYTGLAGLYLLYPSPFIGEAFENVLGPRTVGGELSAQNTSSLHGPEWYYYGARYGEYQAYRKQSGASDLLQAMLEGAPVASDSYVTLGKTYEDLKEPSSAAEQYRFAIELSPRRADVYDRLAFLAMKSGQRMQAIEDFRRAFRLLAARVEEGPLPPDYWDNARSVLSHMNQYGATGDLKADADAMLRAYIKRNGAYNISPMLEGLLDQARERKTALDWVIQLSSLPNAQGLLRQVLNSQWIPQSDKEPLYRAQIDHARQNVIAAIGDQAAQAREALRTELIEYARYLGDQRRPADEWAVLEQIQPPSDRPPDAVLETAALTGRLDELFKTYENQPESAPTGDQALAVASLLQKRGRQDLALKIEEFEYQRELQSSTPPTAAWFGLARVRFEQKRTADALTLIRDAALSAGEPFENLPEAVRVLETYGLKTDAANYAEQWKTAEPWNDEAQFTCARLKSDVPTLNTLQQSPTISYSIRRQAAQKLGELGNRISGSDELSLLTRKTISVSEASQPFFVYARLEAAKTATPEDQAKLYRQVAALDPNLLDAKLNLAAAALKMKDTVLGLAAFESYQNSRYQAEASTASPDTLLEVEEMAAAAFVETNDFARAIETYATLLRQTTDLPKRAELTQAKRAVEEKQALETLNAGREPVVTNETAQRVIVKPKLRSLLPDQQPPDSRSNGVQQ